jgi:hypothetical protein
MEAPPPPAETTGLGRGAKSTVVLEPRHVGVALVLLHVQRRRPHVPVVEVALRG